MELLGITVKMLQANDSYKIFTLIFRWNIWPFYLLHLFLQTKPGCYVSNVTDKVLIPGVYETADEKIARRLEKVEWYFVVVIK